MVVVGRIYEIHHINDKSIQVVIRKKDRDKIIFQSYELFGFWKDKFISMNITPRDKIKANVHISATFNKDRNRWYNNIFFRDVYLVEKAIPKMKKTTELFDNISIDKQSGLHVDTESGEVI